MRRHVERSGPEAGDDRGVFRFFGRVDGEDLDADDLFELQCDDEGADAVLLVERLALERQHAARADVDHHSSQAAGRTTSRERVS